MGLLKQLKKLFGRPKKEFGRPKRKPRYRKPKSRLKWAKYDALRKKERVTIRLPKTYILKYKALCNRLNISFSEMVYLHIVDDLHKARMKQFAEKIRARVEAKVRP